MSVSVRYGAELTITETLAAGVPFAAAPSFVTTPNVVKTTYDATTTPAVTKSATLSKAMIAGAGTIDLTNLVGPGGAAVTFAGLKVQFVRFRNDALAAITVTFGAANPYLLGGAGFVWVIPPGGELVFFGNGATPVVDGTHKNIDISGTLIQELHVELVAG